MNRKLNIAFFGSCIVSAYWNGAVTYRHRAKLLNKIFLETLDKEHFQFKTEKV